MKKLVFLLLLSLNLLSQHSLYGQACIKAYDAKSGQEISVFCAGTQVRFKSCNPDSRPDLEYYDFDKSNGIQIDRDTTKYFTYSTPGTYTVTQVINTGVNGVHQGKKTFTVLPVPKPTFKAIGCSQGNVKVTITDQNYDAFQVAFGSSPPQTLSRGASATHQFAAGQPMQVTVTGHYSKGLCSNSADTLLQERPLPPTPQLSKVQVLLPLPDGRISFTIDQTRPEYYYLIEKQNGAGFSVLDTIKNPAASQVIKVLTQINARDQACYRIRATDPCGTNLPVASNMVCSLPLTITAGQDIRLSWAVYPQPALLTGYQLYKNGKPYRELPQSQNSFTDERVTCHQQNCYELIALLSNNVQSVSNNPCATIVTSPPPAPPTLASTFTPDNRIQLHFQVPASQILKQITYQKRIDGSGFSDLGVSKTTAYEDNTFNKSQLICYQAFYQDSCDQTSPVSNQTCPIVLKASQQANNTVLLSWSSYVGYPAGLVQYLVEKMGPNGQVLASIPVTGNSYSDSFSANSGQKSFYRIQGMAPGQEPTYSNTESAAFEAILLIPTAFTPNSDNLNDLFEVKGRFIRVTRLRIYDRWGQVIYQSQGQGWDGRIKGQEAPPGTYPYSVSWEDENGKLSAKTGIVSLLR